VEQEGTRILARKSPSHRSFGQELALIWEMDTPFQALGLYGSQPWPKYHRSVPGVLLSSLLHFSFIFLLVRLPIAKLLVRPEVPEVHHTEHLVYMLQPLSSKNRLPNLKPPGSGGRPGRGSRPERPPARGGQAFHPTLTIISNPPHPDNDRQTIIQASSPPQLKIPKEIRLPNILIGNLPAPPPRPAPPPPKPIETHVVVPPRSTVAPPSAPALALVPPRNPLPNPSLPVPLPAAPSPPAPPEPAPQPTAQPAPATQATEKADARALAELDTRKTSAANAGLLSLSVEPAPPTDSVTLPPGNRQGAFSISPQGGKPGSPGGVPGGDPLGGGAGGNGPAGDSSTGVGSGDKGGGGAGSLEPGIGPNVSITGSTSGDPDALLPSFFSAAAVYPVAHPGIPRPMMVVTTGPTGGGGLRVYGVLKGKKIYTVYLPMPEKNWILQYCAHDSSGTGQEPEHLRVDVKLEVPVAPPSAMEQFDFRRPPVPQSEPKKNETIILQGIIQEDGLIAELKLYKGVGGVVDQAALAAFGRWKFRPARRDSKPIAIEILVGIPIVVQAK